MLSPRHMNKDDERRMKRNRWIIYISSVSISLLVMIVLMVIMIVNANRDIDTIEEVATKDQTYTITVSTESSTVASTKSNVDINSWNLILVNRGRKIPDNYKVNLREFYGVEVDERCLDALVQMIIACKDDSNEPLICSGYRDHDEQQDLFNEKKDDIYSRHPEYNEYSLTYEAEREVAYPDTSEHQLGLAVDIVDIHDQNLYEAQENTDTQKWLMKHSWEYGFILRYPKGKENITGVSYEPWHYRYVGYDNAEYIYKHNLCLEEYINLFK